MPLCQVSQFIAAVFTWLICLTECSKELTTDGSMRWDQCDYPRLGSTACDGNTRICDPDNLLTTAEASRVGTARSRLTRNKEVAKCDGLRVGIALLNASLIPDLSTSGSTSGFPGCAQYKPKLDTVKRAPTENELQSMASTFSSYLLRYWGYILLRADKDYPTCDAALLVFYSREYRRLYLRTSETASQSSDGYKFDSDA